MFYFVVLVVHDVEKLENILTAWSEAGVRGVTVLPSVGMRKIDEERGLREDFPLMPLLSNLFEHDEELNRTLFTIVEGKELVDRIEQATIAILGDLDQPNTGVLAVLPVERALGLHRRD